MCQGPTSDKRERKGRMYCSYYKKSGHTIERCFEIVGFLQWFKGNRQNRNGARPVAYVQRMNSPFELSVNRFADVHKLSE